MTNEQLDWEAEFDANVTHDQSRAHAEWLEITTARMWTVEARSKGGDTWTVWTEWVDRATAEAEKQHAAELGYFARIVEAS